VIKVTGNLRRYGTSSGSPASSSHYHFCLSPYRRSLAEHLFPIRQAAPQCFSNRPAHLFLCQAAVDHISQRAPHCRNRQPISVCDLFRLQALGVLAESLSPLSPIPLFILGGEAGIRTRAENHIIAPQPKSVLAPN